MPNKYLFEVGYRTIDGIGAKIYTNTKTTLKETETLVRDIINVGYYPVRVNKYQLIETKQMEKL